MILPRYEAFSVHAMTIRMQKSPLIIDKDGKARCAWCGDDPRYIKYPDQEWGRPVYDDIRLFEKLCLEGFQAGLSWITILKKRENFRHAFAGFDYTKIAMFTEQDVARLLQDAGIIRHRGKIEATINNARMVPAVIAEFGSFSNYLWRFAPPPKPAPKTMADIPTQTQESKALSKDLKKRGFKFVGPTTMYALMQAMGMVNDHLAGCSAREDHSRVRMNSS